MSSRKSASHICPDCPPLSPKFESNSTLLHHIQEAHPFPKRFRCDDCGRAYARSWSLSSHRRGCTRPAIPDFDAFSLHSSVFSSSDDERFCASPVSDRSFSIIDDVISPKSGRERLILDPPKGRQRSRRSSKYMDDGASPEPAPCGVLSVNCLDLNRLQVMSKNHNLSLSTSMKRVHRNLENLVSAEIRNKMAMNIGSLRNMQSSKKGDEKDDGQNDTSVSLGCSSCSDQTSDMAGKVQDDSDTGKIESEWIAAVIASWIEDLCLAIILRRALLIALLLLCIHILELLVPNTFKYNNILGAISGQAVVHMSYLVPISIVVLWGVCWMFAIYEHVPGDTDSKFEAAFEEFTRGEDYYPPQARSQGSSADTEMSLREMDAIGTSPASSTSFALPPDQDFILYSIIAQESIADDDLYSEPRARSQSLFSTQIPAFENKGTLFSNHNAPLNNQASKFPTHSLLSSPSNPTTSVASTTDSPPPSSTSGDSLTTSQESGSSPTLEDTTAGRYPCGICGHTFSHKSSVARHVRSEHQGNKMECIVPGCKKTMREDNMRRHVANQHPVSLEYYDELLEKVKRRRMT